MDKDRALKIAISCVMASLISKEEKFEVVSILRELAEEDEAEDETPR